MRWTYSHSRLQRENQPFAASSRWFCSCGSAFGHDSQRFYYHSVLKFMNLEGLSQMLQLSLSVVVLVALAEVVGGALILQGGLAEIRRAT